MDRREPRRQSSATASLWRCFEGHLVRAQPSTDYAHALHSLTHGPLKDWKRPAGRPRTTWLLTVESILQPAVNTGLFTNNVLWYSIL